MIFFNHQSSIINLKSFHYTRAEAQVVQGGAGKLTAQLFEQAPLVEVSQLLQQHGIIDNHLQHAATQCRGACVGGIFLSNGLGPRFLQVQPVLATTPAARREQPAQDFSHPFRSSFRHIAAYRHKNLKSEIRNPKEAPMKNTQTQNLCCLVLDF
jgi:hypothetical protein